jgi:hypothetical protein
MRREIACFVAIALSASIPVAACGLTADFSGLQDGGGPDALDAPNVIPTIDANEASDTAPAIDAAEASTADSAEAGDGSTPGFCASLTTPVAFCDDFDEGQTVSAGWDSVDVYQGASVLLDFTYYSKPASFLSQIDAQYYPASARLQKDLPLDTPHVHMEFEMLLPQFQGDVQLCVLHQPVASGTTYGIFYEYTGGNLRIYVPTLEDDGGETDFTSVIGPPPTDWLHVAIDADISESGTLVVSHNGTVVVNATNVDTSTLTRAAMFVELGYYSNDSLSALVHFDNVIIDWKQ